jgi:hypothetical protein
LGTQASPRLQQTFGLRFSTDEFVEVHIQFRQTVKVPRVDGLPLLVDVSFQVLQVLRLQ